MRLSSTIQDQPQGQTNPRQSLLTLYNESADLVADLLGLAIDLVVAQEVIAFAHRGAR